jgi:hypothetical protein
VARTLHRVPQAALAASERASRRWLFSYVDQLKLIMKNSNVVPMLLLSPVFSSYVVPALLPR